VNPDKPRIHIWDMTTGKQLLQWDDHEDGGTCIAFSPNGKLLATGGASVGRDGAAGKPDVRLWHVATGKLVRRWEAFAWHVGFTPDGRFLAFPSSGSLALHDLETGTAVRRFSEAQPPFAFSTDGKTLATGSNQPGNNMIRFWDTDTAQERDPLPPQPKQVQSLAFSPHGKALPTKPYPTTPLPHPP